MNRFEHELHSRRLPLQRGELEVLQINVGRQCNQACRHCHVDAAPWGTETISETVGRRVADWIGRHRPSIVDITGGAPELSAWFKYLVEAARAAGCRVIDRNNLTILHEPGFEHLPEYLAAHHVEVIASLPCYLETNVNRQRGQGVFHKSIEALRRLNAVGYGQEDSPLPLDLVYNPLGAVLPPAQAELEVEYKEVLTGEYGVIFNRLLTITNQPIARFAADLRQSGRWDEYLDLLTRSFNAATVPGLMCRHTLSVGYEGEVYDCDFNQMLGLQLRNGKPLYLWDISPADLPRRGVLTGDHCLACTAGCGSSCTGSLATEP